jgi:hypothetical protein
MLVRNAEYWVGMKVVDESKFDLQLSILKKKKKKIGEIGESRELVRDRDLEGSREGAKTKFGNEPRYPFCRLSCLGTALTECQVTTKPTVLFSDHHSSI